MSDNDIDLGGIGGDNGSQSQSTSSDGSLIRDVIEFCGGPDLIQLFGETGSAKSEFALKVVESAVNDAGKDVLFIDTERNLSDNERAESVDYVYVPEWHDLYGYVGRKRNALSDQPFGENTTNSDTIEDGYDVVVLDSIGFPALMQYDEYSIADDADQFQVFQELQYITGRLKKYAQFNDALIMVTNQPKSELAGEGDAAPFGDKSQFGFKELWKTRKKSSSSIKTKCEVEAYRSRQAGQGKVLFELEIDDSGTTVTDVTDEEPDGDEWT
jgi:hypothetical protein